MKEIKVAISPCPNDTFIFGALMKGLIHTGDLRFTFSLMDIDALNKAWFSDAFDVIKISCGLLPYVTTPVTVLQSGAALGKGCGPLLITHAASDKAKQHAKVLIPGEQTTAHGLLRRYFPEFKNKEVVLFSTIEDILVKNKADYGVIIHENRFTYQSKGLQCVADLGSLWEGETGLPIPLGCIAAKETLSPAEMALVNSFIHQSVLFAFENKEPISDLIRFYASELDEEVQQKHIDLYVTDFSVHLGMEGMNAISEFVTRLYPTQQKPLITFLP